ncbi:hypothetical protein EG329_014121 [Mollisiaceae sp. DMI_Dod_QoI]|nr:hypothetical protein EG329_014121 [Helotiales sp. DMI_Dod_QoI]
MPPINGEADGQTSQPNDDFEGKIFALDISASAEETERMATRMQQRCSLLLDELEQFQSHLKQQKKEKRVEVRGFKTGINAEMKLLNKLATADPNEPKTKHGLRSSNLSFFDTVWSIAKTRSSVVALGKRFFWLPEQTAPDANPKVQTKGTGQQKNVALVDIVSQDGLEWIKVSSITEKRIIWDLTRAGWAGDSSSDEDEDQSSDDGDEPGLVKQVEALVKASRATRIRYRHPTVRLILPRIKAVPDSKEVGNVLQQIKDLGVHIQTSEDVSSQYPSISSVVNRMAVDRSEPFSEVLNIDCTILLAFASDLSHSRVAPEDWHNKAISRQIEMESEDQLLPSNLWPTCGSRKMVCTSEAAVRMQEIVDIIGTETEKRRAVLLLSTDDTTKLSKDDRLQEFQRLSDYNVPSEWALPIEVVDVDISSMISSLPSSAEKVSENLTPINQSVFLYGWLTHRTTISSNGSVAKDIETTIETNRVDEKTQGPDIWLSASSRSLVGKEKERRGANGKGALPQD